jgi:flagellar assembly protein FliH
MSNLWSLESAGRARPLGTFALERQEQIFTPWGGVEDEDERPVAQPAAIDIEAIRADAFADGWAEGRRTVEVEIAAERDVLARLAESLDVLRPEPTNALALLLAETVDRLVRQIVGLVEVDGALLTERAEAAAALIGEETGPARLRINPADIALLDGARIPVAIVGDDHVERGALVLETGQGWIEDGPAIRLERLRAELDRMGAER